MQALFDLEAPSTATPPLGSQEPPSPSTSSPTAGTATEDPSATTAAVKAPKAAKAPQVGASTHTHVGVTVDNLASATSRVTRMAASYLLMCRVMTGKVLVP